jgi:preprotein translocase subunit SecF
MSMKTLANRMYTGETTIQFVGRRRLWFTISALACVISLIALFYPGLNLGIDFKGGSIFRAEAVKHVTVEQVRNAIGPDAQVVQVTEDSPPQVIVQTEEQPADRVAQINAQLKQLTGAPQVSTDAVGSKWGETVSRRALLALAVFIAAVVVYVSIRFEPKMSGAALVALVHDLLITAGVYALARFEVTPATVIALLTILGYSLYDTVVVFDKVKENTGTISSVSRTTYSDAANLAVNQTAVRSLNTSLTSLLPVGALLLGGSFLLGGEVLKDLSLALFVGVGVGTYSSMFLGVPLLAAWKEREPRFRDLRARIQRRETAGARQGVATGRAAATAGSGTAGAREAGAGAEAGAREAGARADAGAAKASPSTRSGSRSGPQAQARRRPSRPAAAQPPFQEEEPLLPSVPPDPDDDYVTEDYGSEGYADQVDDKPAPERPTREPAVGSSPRPRTGQRPKQRRKGGKQQASGGKRRRR